MAKSMIGSTCLVAVLAISASGASGGMISGSVKDPGGAPFKGAFVRARNVGTKMTVSVLSNRQGQYRIENLPPGEYEVRINAVGYRSDPRTGVKVAEGQSLSFDYPLQKGIVRWSDLSDYQGKMLLPAGKGKKELFENCLACHGFQSRMASTRRDEASWQRAVDFMRDPSNGMGVFLGARFTDQMAADTVSYLTTVFGVDSELPRSPADLPRYRELVREFSDEAMNIVYVEYELPGPNRFPWNAAPDKDGNFWMPYYGKGNAVGKLDPRTGKVEEFKVPNLTTALVHSAVPAPDGTVWNTEQATNKIGRWDPRTRTITEYQAPSREAGSGGRRGSKHTVRVDSQGTVWTTGSPLSRFDPKTAKFTEIPEVPSVYGIAIAKDGTIWFAEFIENGQIGKVDPKTLKVTKWTPPTPNARPRRIQVDSEGIVWFGEYGAGKIGRFDPKTETFNEYPLPGPSPTPYAIGIDKNNSIWFSERDMDVMGRLDPKTGRIVEYPPPYPENTMRDFFTDAEGRVWWTSPANNKVGYLMLAGGQ